MLCACWSHREPRRTSRGSAGRWSRREPRAGAGDDPSGSSSSVRLGRVGAPCEAACEAAKCRAVRVGRGGPCDRRVDLNQSRDAAGRRTRRYVSEYPPPKRYGANAYTPPPPPTQHRVIQRKRQHRRVWACAACRRRIEAGRPAPYAALANGWVPVSVLGACASGLNASVAVVAGSPKTAENEAREKGVKVGETVRASPTGGVACA